VVLPKLEQEERGMGWMRVEFENCNPPTKAMQELNAEAEDKPEPRGFNDEKLEHGEIKPIEWGL